MAAPVSIPMQPRHLSPQHFVPRSGMNAQKIWTVSHSGCRALLRFGQVQGLAM